VYFALQWAEMGAEVFLATPSVPLFFVDRLSGKSYGAVEAPLTYYEAHPLPEQKTTRKESLARRRFSRNKYTKAPLTAKKCHK
jgi:hypothetical protein